MSYAITKTLLCPKCGHDSVVWEEKTDSATLLINGKESLVEKYIGYCKNCGRNVEWENVYVFVGFRCEKAYYEE